jgi:hypothetical protein
VEQALVGLAWTFSIAAITGATAVWQVADVQLLFLSLGFIALLLVLSCWLWSKRPIEMACDMCEAKGQFVAVACMMARGANLQLPGVITGLTCGKECRCHK